MNAPFETGQLSLKEVFASTLIHSLWQGAVIVLLMWIIRLALRKHTNLNYVLSLMALILMMLASLFTFFYFKIQNSVGFYPHSFLSEALSRPDILQWIHIFWSLGACMFFLRFVFSHFYLKKLIRSSQAIKDTKWQELFQSIRQYYALQKTVMLLQSEKVSSAFLTGVIKPVIIIPTSWINHLNYREAECILAHELSHISNRDHWVNLFIHFAEIIYYFNPAVHILIGHIKLERELKADQSACNYLQDPLLYAKLILKIEEESTALPAFTLPFFGQKNQLKRRIESILKLNAGHKEFTSRIAIFGILFSVLLFISIKLDTPTTQNNIVQVSEQLCLPKMNKIEHIQVRKKEILQEEIVKLNNNTHPVHTEKEHVFKLTNKVKSTKNAKEEYPDDEELEEAELIAFESDDDNILDKIEMEIKADKKLRRTIIYEISKTHKDSNETTQGGNWTQPRQIRYYAPAETKTYIIIKTRNTPCYEAEPDWNALGKLRNLMRDKN
jgi:beta-lactamase regulating signal transducer with metallopeptidase domain